MVPLFGPRMITSLLLLALGQTSVAPILLKSGDVVSVFVATADTNTAPYNGDYTILSDGAIYGTGFGRLEVAGKTWLDAQALLRSKMKRFFLAKDVFLAVKKQRPDYAYVVGSNSPGPVVLPSSRVTVRQLLPPLTDKQDGQRLDVEVVRDGKTLARTDYARLLQQDDAVGNMAVMPNDLISIIPQATIRIWVLGGVKAPGQLALPIGTDLYQAVAAAGGYSRLEAETTLALRHGPGTSEFPSRVDPSQKSPDLADGDVVTAVIPETVKVTIAGEVAKPGEYALLDNTSVLNALSSASGPLPSGNLSDVLVYRNGELLDLDLTGQEGAESKLRETIRSGDTIIVRERTRMFYVFGEVRNPGRITMDEHKTYHAADALAMAGGLNEKGTFRRVYLMHPVPNSKPTIVQFNLDEFLKDGKMASNPLIQPGDSLLFGQPRGLTLASVGQILSSFVVLNSLARTP